MNAGGQSGYGIPRLFRYQRTSGEILASAERILAGIGPLHGHGAQPALRARRQPELNGMLTVLAGCRLGRAPSRMNLAVREERVVGEPIDDPLRPDEAPPGLAARGERAGIQGLGQLETDEFLNDEGPVLGGLRRQLLGHGRRDAAELRWRLNLPAARVHAVVAAAEELQPCRPTGPATLGGRAHFRDAPRA